MRRHACARPCRQERPSARGQETELGKERVGRRAKTGLPQGHSSVWATTTSQCDSTVYLCSRRCKHKVRLDFEGYPCLFRRCRQGWTSLRDKDVSV